MRIPQHALIELHLLRNRLEAGESPLQAISQMKNTEKLPENFSRAWRALEHSILEGRLSPLKAVEEFTERYQKSNDLADMIEQKSMSARIQAYVVTALSLFIAVIATFFFPETLRPSFNDMLICFALLACAWIWQKRMLEDFRKDCFFMDWLHFFRGLSLSLQMGMILPRAIEELHPIKSIANTWPISITSTEPLKHEPKTPQKTETHWKLAQNSWNEVQRLYESGHPLSKLILHLSDIQEKTFRREIIFKTEKLSYKLMLPLFLCCLPAMLWLFFSPLLKSLSVWFES